MNDSRQRLTKSHQKLPPPINIDSSDDSSSAFLSPIKENKNNGKQVVDYEALIKNSHIQMNNLKSQIKVLTENLENISETVEKIIPDEIKSKIPNLGQTDYVISVVRQLSAFYTSRNSESFLSKQNEDKEAIIIQNNQLNDENTRLKSLIDELESSKKRIQRQLSESEKVRLEILRENESKTKQINNIELDRVNIIRRLTEELHKKDETIEFYKQTKFGKQISSNDISGPASSRDAVESKSNIKEIQFLLENSQKKVVESDTRIKTLEETVLKLQTELKGSLKTITDMKQIIDDKNKQIYELENRLKIENENKNKNLENELQVTKNRLEDITKQLEESQKQLQTQMNKPNVIDETNTLRSAIIEKDNEIQQLGESLHILSTEKEENQIKYERKIQSLSSQIASEKQKLTKQYNEQINQLKSQMNEQNQKLNSQIEEEKRKFSSVMSILSNRNPKDFFEEFSSMQEEIQTQDQRIKELQQEKVSLQNEIFENQKNSQTLKFSISQRDNEINDLKLQLQNSTSLIEYKKVVAEKQELEETIKEREEFISSLQTKISSEIDVCKTKLKDQNAKLIENLTFTNTKLGNKENQVARLQSVVIESEQKISQLKEKLKSTLEENVRLGSEIEEMKKHMENTNIEIEVNNDAIVDLQETISKLTKDREILMIESENNAAENEILKKQVKKLEKKYDKLHESISQKEMMMSELEDTIEKMKTEKSTQIQSLVKKVEEKEKQIKENELTFREMQNTQTMMEQNQKHENELYQIKISEFESKVAKLERIVTKLKNYITNLQDEKTQYESKVKELKQIAKNQMQTSLDFQNEAEKHKEIRLTSEMAFNTLSKKYNELNAQYNERNNAIDALTKDLETIRNQLNEKNLEIEKLNKNLENTQNQKDEIIKLQSQLQEFIDTSKTKESELVELKQKSEIEKTNLQKILEENSKNKEEYEKKINKLEMTIVSLTEQTQTLPPDATKKITELEIENKNLKETYENEKQNNDKQIRILKRENEEFKQKVNDYKQEIINLSNDIDKSGTTFENKLQAKVREIQDLKTKNEDLYKTIEDLKEDMKSYREQLTSANSALTAKLEAAANSLKVSQNNEKQKSEETKKLLAENSELQKQIALLTKQVDDKTAALDLLQTSHDQLTTQYDEIRLSSSKQIDSLKHQIADQQADIGNISNSLKKKAQKVNKLKELLNQSVNIKDFEKLSKKYLAIKNLYDKSEKKLLSAAIDEGTIREQQMADFLAKIDAQQKEIDGLKDEIESKKDFIRKLQRQIATDGQKLEEISSQPFVPLSELTAARQQLRQNMKTINELTSKVAVLEQNLAKTKQESDKQKEIDTKEKKDLKELVDTLSQKNEKFLALNTKMSVFHSIVKSETTQKQQNYSILTVIKDSLNDLFTQFNLPPIDSLGNLPVLTIQTPSNVFNIKPYDDEKISKKIDEITREIENLPVKVIDLAPLDNSSSLMRLTQIALRLKRISATISDRDKLLKRMSVLIDSQHKAVLQISESPKDKSVVKLSSRNVEESHRILEEIAKIT